MSSSTDDTENERREKRMKELTRLRHMIRKKRALKLKKNIEKPAQITSMPLSGLRRIGNSETKESPNNLKSRLVEYLKKQKHVEDVKANLEKKEKQKMEERYDLDFNENRTKVRVKSKENKDLEQEIRNEQRKINKNRNIPILRQPLKKRSKKGIDKNGNIIKSYPHYDYIKLVQSIIQRIDIDQIVEKCTNEFIASIKNAIKECVKKPDSVNNEEIDDSTSEESEKYDTTNDELLTPYSDLSSECDYQPDIVTQKDNLDIQDSKYMKVYLEKGEDINLYHIDHEKSTKSLLEERKRLRKRLSNEKEGDEENNEKWYKNAEERYQNIEMGRKIFENAYRFFENSEGDEEKEFEQKQQVSKKRRSSSSTNSECSTKTNDTYTVSKKEKSEPEHIKIEIDMGMVDPRDIYLSSLPQYEEIRTEVLVPKCWIDDQPSSLEHSPESDDDATFIISPIKEEIPAEAESSTDRSVPADSQENVNDDRITNNKQTENGNENCNGPQFNIVKATITDYVSSIRQKYEKEQSTKTQNRTYQALEEERIQCQRRINRVMEFLRTLTTKKHNSKSSSSEITDDDGFEKSTSTVTEVSRRGKKGKRNETKRSSSPVLIYHYYRVDPKAKRKMTIDANANCIPKLEADNPSNLTSRPRRGPRTPPPQESSSDGEIHDDSSEEREHNKYPLESVHVQYNNRVAVLKQEETTRDARLQNIDNSKTSYQTSKIHYEKMTITRSFDNRPINKYKP